MGGPEDPEVALREARQRLIATFDDVCAGVERALETGPVALRSSTQQVHRLAGLAGIVGFPRVSDRALELESALSGSAHAEAIRWAVDALREAFADDLTSPPPDWL